MSVLKRGQSSDLGLSLSLPLPLPYDVDGSVDTGAVTATATSPVFTAESSQSTLVSPMTGVEAQGGGVFDFGRCGEMKISEGEGEGGEERRLPEVESVSGVVESRKRSRSVSLLEDDGEPSMARILKPSNAQNIQVRSPHLSQPTFLPILL